MKVHYFEDTDSAIFTFREDADYDDSEEIFDGFIIDFDKSGRPMGLDVYQDASQFFDRSWLRKHVVVAETKPQASIIRDAPMKDDE
jgi:uncharacterized protein YuzE